MARRSRPDAAVTIVRPGIQTLDPRARAVALRLAGGDARRVYVLGRHEAMVRNA
jgi:hypothetical protein